MYVNNQDKQKGAEAPLRSVCVIRGSAPVRASARSAASSSIEASASSLTEALAPSVLASRLSSCIMKSRRLPTWPPFFRMWRVSPKMRGQAGQLLGDVDADAVQRSLPGGCAPCASWRDSAAANSSPDCKARPSASCMRSTAFCWNCRHHLRDQGVMRLTITSIASMRDSQHRFERRAFALAADSTKAFDRAGGQRGATSACSDSWPTLRFLDHAGPAQQFSHRHDGCGIGRNAGLHFRLQRVASSVSRAVFSACVPAVAALRPKLRRHSTLPRVMAAMIAVRNIGSKRSADRR
jgi:hypothetical protein